MLFNMPDARRTHSHTFMLRSKVCDTVVMTSMSLARVVRAHQSVGTILHTFAVWICMRLCKLCRQRCDTHAAGAVAKVMVLSWDNYRTTTKKHSNNSVDFIHNATSYIYQHPTTSHIKGQQRNAHRTVFLKFGQHCIEFAGSACSIQIM